MEKPPDRRRHQQRHSKRGSRGDSGPDFEYGGPPHPERADDAPRNRKDLSAEYGGPIQRGADIEGIPAPGQFKLSVGKWLKFKFHGPIEALIPVLAIVGVITTGACFLKGGITGGIAVAALTALLTLILAIVDVKSCRGKKESSRNS